jgi:4'-phosphopantetheinyl transferase
MIHWPVWSGALPLLCGAVHVWGVALDDPHFDRQAWLERLAPAEQARARRFKFEVDRRRYIVAHVALRDILAAQVRVAAEDLRFVDGEHGKPRLALTHGSVEFNLSHSHERAVIAATQDRAVGIDIEFVKRDFGFHEVAERFFTQREVFALRALPLELQLRAFYKCWTSKEAFLKAKGTGLSGALDEVAIDAAPHQGITIAASVYGWSLTELAPGDDYEGALVVEGAAALPVHCYRWSPA